MSQACQRTAGSVTGHSGLSDNGPGTRRRLCRSELSPTSLTTITNYLRYQSASATSHRPTPTTVAGTRSWPKVRRSRTRRYNSDVTTIGPTGSERPPPKCPLAKGRKVRKLLTMYSPCRRPEHLPSHHEPKVPTVRRSARRSSPRCLWRRRRRSHRAPLA